MKLSAGFRLDEALAVSASLKYKSGTHMPEGLAVVTVRLLPVRLPQIFSSSTAQKSMRMTSSSTDCRTSAMLRETTVTTFHQNENDLRSLNLSLMSLQVQPTAPGRYSSLTAWMSKDASICRAKSNDHFAPAKRV